MSTEPVIYLIDDDKTMRQSLVFVLTHAGYRVRAYSSPPELLRDYDVSTPGCLVFDLQMPEMTGLQLLRELKARGDVHPFIVITGHGTIRAAVEAMHLGAIDFIEKPFHHDLFLERVSQAIARDQEARLSRRSSAAIQEQITALTSREREIMQLVVDGQLTKNIAKKLGISTKTVEVHRSNITKKMGVDSVVQLVKMVTSLNIPQP